MSNLAINIRFLWFFMQISFYGKIQFSKSAYWLDRRREAILKPFFIYDFRPMVIYNFKKYGQPFKPKKY